MKLKQTKKSKPKDLKTIGAWEENTVMWLYCTTLKVTVKVGLIMCFLHTDCVALNSTVYWTTWWVWCSVLWQAKLLWTKQKTAGGGWVGRRCRKILWAEGNGSEGGEAGTVHIRWLGFLQQEIICLGNHSFLLRCGGFHSVLMRAWLTPTPAHSCCRDRHQQTSTD